MPTYDYRCKSCVHEFELFQSMSEPVKRRCPKCGKNALERLIGTGAALLFKGSGFYQTDYRSESYKKAAESETKPASDSKSGGDAKKTETTKAESPKAKPAKKAKPAVD